MVSGALPLGDKWRNHRRNNMTTLLRTTRPIALWSFILFVFWPIIAGAIPIGPGDTVRVDFDLSSEFPPPPYSNITAFYGFGPIDLLDPGEGWTVSIFDEENEPALNSFSFISSFPSQTGIFQGIFDSPSLPAFSDGAGFLLLTDIVGTFELTTVQFSGTNLVGSTPFVEGIIALVPEPTALVLIVTGLAGLGFARWRKLQKSRKPGCAEA
jgi:hypothetical protein